MTAARAWFGVAAAALGTAAVCALLLVAGRLPLAGDPLRAEQWFGAVLVLHVDFALVFWFLAACGCMWLLDSRDQAAPRGPAWLAATAATLAALAAFTGAAPVLNNYVPIIDTPLFLGALAAFVFAVMLVAASGLRRGRALPAGTLWSMVAFLTMMATALVAAAESWTLLGRPRWEATFWGAGHLLQFVYVLVLMRLWQHAAGNDRAEAEGPFLRGCYAVTGSFALFGLVVALHGDAADVSMRDAWTMLMALGTWPGPFALYAYLLYRSRQRGALLRETGPSALLFALGIALGARLSADNVSVPAHYHATVGAVTLAFLGATPALAVRMGMGWPSHFRARLQPWLFGVGAVLLVGGLALNGLADLPRKSPGSAGGVAAIMLFGIGGALSVFAALLYCALAFGALRAVAPAGRACGPRRDVRPMAAATAVGAVVALGAVIAWWPQFPPPAQAAIGPAEHARQMKLREIEKRFAQGVVMLHAKQYEHALTAFHRVLELDPAMPEAHVNTGFALLGMGEHAKARDFFESAIELRAHQLNAYYGLAVALEGLGDMDGARGAMRAYAHLAPAEDPFRRRAEAALWEWAAAARR